MNYKKTPIPVSRDKYWFYRNLTLYIIITIICCVFDFKENQYERSIGFEKPKLSFWNTIYMFQTNHCILDLMKFIILR